MAAQSSTSCSDFVQIKATVLVIRPVHSAVVNSYLT